MSESLIFAFVCAAAALLYGVMQLQRKIKLERLNHQPERMTKGKSK